MKYKLQYYRAIKEFVGVLKLFKSGKTIGKWKARSGQPGFRSFWTCAKSPIPASNAIEGEYSVNPGYAPGDMGACGDTFYHIIPDPIRQENGSGQRSEVGIHCDANIAYAPGTAGCIGVDPEDWDSCRNMLDSVFAQECEKDPSYRIPLEVIYGVVSAIPNYPVIPDSSNPSIISNSSETPFQKALKFTLEWEGGYVNNPADYGGRTNKGITQAVYSAWRQKNNYPVADVAKITDAEAQAIYLQDYWTASRADEMCEPLSIVHFDTAVNFGVGGAGEFLQEAIGFTGDDVDGMIGPVTMAKLKDGKDNKATALLIVEKRIAYRKQRVKREPSQQVFLKGWLNRDYALKRLIRDETV